MHIEDFDELVEFPKHVKEVVYVLFWEDEKGNKTPFYVGQTGRFLSSRVADYLYADFQAQTDFKVGEAIRYLVNERKVRVFIGQRQSTNPLADEQSVIESITAKKIPLLNRRLGYNYRTTEEGEQRAHVRGFCDKLLSDAGSTSD